MDRALCFKHKQDGGGRRHGNSANILQTKVNSHPEEQALNSFNVERI